jgi:DNA repair exonuclease SbcCD nuclease subunit
MIKTIIHISDLHIRTIQYHDNYRDQFKKLFIELNERFNGVDESELRIVITGDIVHQKVNISNEQLILCSWVLNELSKIAKVIIIPGNHDFLENNIQRLDSITPIVKLLNNDRVVYYKDYGIYDDLNIKWVVYSLYQHNKKPKFEKEEGFVYVALFHGPIKGLSTEMGYEFDDAFDKLNFVDCDVALCGDIHMRQRFKLPNGGDGIQIGSFIQQNFAETVKHHGYGLFDVLKNEYTFHDIENNNPFYHFVINDIKDIEDGKELLINIG